MKRARLSGFTLIELLVVVAIIALLIAILIPSLGKAKELANRSTCSANLHGIMESMILYAGEQVTGGGGGGSFPNVGEAVGGGGDGKSYLVQSVQYRGSQTDAATAMADMLTLSNASVVGSPTAGLWMLVLRGQTAPKNALCKSDTFGTSPALLSDTASNQFYEDYGASNLSYAVAFPWTQSADTTSTGPWFKDNTDSTCPYLSDMPPVDGETYDGGTINVENASTTTNGPASYNSRNHNGAGQNVAYGDVHVEWKTTPVCGAGGGSGTDNIFTACAAGTTPAGPDPVGVPPASPALGNVIALTNSPPYDVNVVPARSSPSGALR